MIKDYNKGNDCDCCEHQYLCGTDGDATGCKLADEGKECNFIATKEIDNMLEFAFAANRAVKTRGKEYSFTCPLCGGTAHVGRSDFNGHINASCNNCGMNIIE